jgi:GT2 family glycosyltransferase
LSGEAAPSRSVGSCAFGARGRAVGVVPADVASSQQGLGVRAAGAWRNGGSPQVSVSVVICAYSDRRWEDLVAAVASVHDQDWASVEIVLVIDHNEPLLEQARGRFRSEIVVPNREVKGLSGARNTGVASSNGDVIVFLDDDAAGEEGWLAKLVSPYGDPLVLGVGGVARPAWPVGRPAWFPPEFDWVVGCSYEGLPVVEAVVRNFIGANMSFRRRVFAEIGGFRTDIGRNADVPLGCEETEFAIRVRQRMPEGRLVHMPSAVVCHRVTPDRTTLAYFLRRCFAEGLSKAAVADAVGAREATASERTYVTRTLTAGFARGLGPGPGSPAASLVIVFGFLVTSIAYGVGVAGFGRSGLRLLERRPSKIGRECIAAMRAFFGRLGR